MEYHRCFCLLFILFTGFVSVSQGSDFYVGGGDGWVLHPSEDYNHWSQRNRFQINDSLIFKFKEGSDSVLLVDKTDFYNCNRDNPIKKMENGESVFKLDRSGPFFFISGNKNGSCEKGQRLVIIVLSVRPYPMPPSPMGQTPAPGANPPVMAPAMTPAYSPVSQAPVAKTPVLAPAYTPAMAPKSPSPSAHTPAYSPSSHAPVMAPAQTPAMTPKSPSSSAHTPAYSPSSHVPVMAPAYAPAMTPKSSSPSVHTPAYSPPSHAPAKTPAMAPKSPSPANSPSPSAKAPATSPPAATPSISPAPTNKTPAPTPPISHAPVPSPSEDDTFPAEDVHAPAPSPSAARRVVVTPSAFLVMAVTLVLSYYFCKH